MKLLKFLSAYVCGIALVAADHVATGQEAPLPATPSPAAQATDQADLGLDLIEADASQLAEAEPLGYRPLNRGPLHEAFAQPIDSDPNDDVQRIAKAPPAPVDEQPPPRPGDDAKLIWIGGYWAWSDEADDFVWVSGTWRKPPPGRTWIPGYWAEQDGSFQWTTGYWAGTTENASAESVEFLPQPPISIDNGPSVPPPSDNHFWVPGHWAYAGNSDYRWSSGFWSIQYDNWVWNPGHYLCTPSGYLWIDGYWDYLPTVRGSLYAPVQFVSPVYATPNYVYLPRYRLLNTAALLVHLFVRPGYPCYFYGSYYGPRYDRLGYRPWYLTGYSHRNATPWLDHYDRKYRQRGVDFSNSMAHYANDWSRGSGRPITQLSNGQTSLNDRSFSQSRLDTIDEAVQRNAYRARDNWSMRSSSVGRFESVQRGDSFGTNDRFGRGGVAGQSESRIGEPALGMSSRNRESQQRFGSPSLQGPPLSSRSIESNRSGDSFRAVESMRGRSLQSSPASRGRSFSQDSPSLGSRSIPGVGSGQGNSSGIGSRSIGSSIGQGNSISHGGSINRGGSFNSGGSINRGGSFNSGGSINRGGSFNSGGSINRGGSFRGGGPSGRGGGNSGGSGRGRR
jgi:hypothetical protein